MSSPVIRIPQSVDEAIQAGLSQIAELLAADVQIQDTQPDYPPMLVNIVAIPEDENERHKAWVAIKRIVANTEQMMLTIRGKSRQG